MNTQERIYMKNKLPIPIELDILEIVYESLGTIKNYCNTLDDIRNHQKRHNQSIGLEIVTPLGPDAQYAPYLLMLDLVEGQQPNIVEVINTKEVVEIYLEYGNKFLSSEQPPLHQFIEILSSKPMYDGLIHMTQQLSERFHDLDIDHPAAHSYFLDSISQLVAGSVLSNNPEMLYNKVEGIILRTAKFSEMVDIIEDQSKPTSPKMFN